MFRLVRRPALKLASTYCYCPKVHYPCRAIGTIPGCNADVDSHHDDCHCHNSNIGGTGLKSDSTLLITGKVFSRLDKDVSNMNLKLTSLELGQKEMKGQMKDEIKDLTTMMERKFGEAGVGRHYLLGYVLGSIVFTTVFTLMLL
ncbi:hypothetical protein L873DRAFT_1848543 [Choiromyces venosus 120613-1]|uniref:Uncharacterized protein n=1 Tax=Choiromyces venosus 120613-1 TaxID=1336337 RepID=A0A3N4IYL7_9PEZI|nr:hypothetical protein L873DRAFT_1848543 [Choiromyces venosus 120613-1]